MRVKLSKTQFLWLRNYMFVRIAAEGDYYHNPFWYKDNKDGTFTEVKEKDLPTAVIEIGKDSLNSFRGKLYSVDEIADLYEEYKKDVFLSARGSKTFLLSFRQWLKTIEK